MEGFCPTGFREAERTLQIPEDPIFSTAPARGQLG